MPNESEQIIAVFKQFVEAGLIEHNSELALSLVADDVIGIGMGAQGNVSSKADVARIIGDGKPSDAQDRIKIEYKNIQIRCYESRYGTVCGVLKIETTDHEKTVTSTLGQIMNLQKRDGRWLICALQATPIFEQIEELEAYPIKFAENLLEAYRQQEQIAQNAQSDNVAVYMVNFTKGIFENAVLKNDIVTRTQKGESYEAVIFREARNYLKDEERYKFISTFSLGNVLKAYQNGETELSLEYEMIVSEKSSIWMRTILKLYVDKADENLKGYLYVVDIDKEKRREIELQSRTELDSMTGLYNKKYSELKIAEKLLAISPVNQGAFLMIDLDYFKNVNDTYGHQEGDRVIRETARCILAISSKNDVAGRLGGDEFCVYFQGELSYELILEKANLLCANIRKLLPADKVGISCSIGIVFCSSPDLSFPDVYQKADQALYQQKKNGRNGFTIYAES